MKRELDELLCSRYPKIFQDRNAPITQTCMGWGFDCGDGWFDLIDTLCERLQFSTDRVDAPQVVAAQVKEKFGELRFYVQSATDEQRGMIDMAEAMSERICEECGKPGTLLVAGAYMTRCPEHAPEGAITAKEWEKSQLEKREKRAQDKRSPFRP